MGGVVAFLFAAVLDWVWQIPILPLAMLLLAGALITAGVRSRGRAPQIHPAIRVACAVVALAGIVGIAIPLSSATLIRESQSQAQAANLPGALESALSAANVEPDAGLPYLQQALVLEQAGEYRAAINKVRAATGNEPTNWRNWLVLSRLQAESGQAKAAVHSYRRAASLNPNSPIFEP
jgi:tetratricopeptide (TPR) repeat protein